MRKNKFKFWFDMTMLIVLSLLYSPHSTGITFHEIAGVVLGGALIVHILLNVNWVIGISKKIFLIELNKRTRFSYLLNVLLLIDMFFIMFSGLLISKIVTPNFRIFSNANWLPIHIFSAILGIIIVGIHIGLHWNWLKQIISRFPRVISMFELRRSMVKIIAGVLLIVGTGLTMGEASKMIFTIPEVFGSSVMDHNGHREGKDREFTGENKQHDRNEEGISILRLAGSIPNLIGYASALGTVAFYTYLVERRMKRKETVHS